MSRGLGLVPSHGRCARCGKPALVDTGLDGECICGNCGLVVAERSVDQGPDWRSFIDEDQDRARAGAPTSITYWDMGLSTMVGSNNMDASGRAFSPTMRSSINRLRTWDMRSPAASSQKGLIIALRELDKTAEKLGVSEAVKERAAYIYRKALARGLVRGRSITGISAAALYAAIRDMETPRTLKDVAAANNLDKKDVARDYRKLLREMDLTMPVADAARSVNRIASQVGLPERVARKAIGIIDMIEKREISAGKSPMGLAAASLYLAAVLEREIKTQKEIADAAGVTEVTVRNRYKGLRVDLGRELGLDAETSHDDPASTRGVLLDY
ncbi:MAG: transcription initiation factor IIB [Nitrososphaerota archaeon]|nr:transcription initiation factor IIB [Nitrososphaerota archaeon]MDG7023924.1 transcription initiation factor IIB [Nitrososphaerota archaeon]